MPKHKKTNVIPLTTANYHALAEFRYALRTFLAFSENAAGEVGLSPQAHQTLLAIKGSRNHERLNIREIAARLLVRHHTAVELVDRLENRGLVKRARDSDDTRRVHVLLTDKAERLLQTLSVAHLRELRAIRPSLVALLEQFN